MVPKAPGKLMRGCKSSCFFSTQYLFILEANVQFSAVSHCTTCRLLFLCGHTTPAAGAASPPSRQHRPCSISKTTWLSSFWYLSFTLALCFLPPYNFAPVVMACKGTRRRKFLLVEWGLTQTCWSACRTVLDAKLTARMNQCCEIEVQVYHLAVWTSRWQM